jgi:hypothetical protein
MRERCSRYARRETAPVNWVRVTVVELTGDKWLMGTFTFAFLGLLVGGCGLAGHLLRPVPSRNRRNSLRPVLRPGLLDVRLARDPGTDHPSQSRPARRRDGLARGVYDDVGLTAHGIADDCCAREYLQNKI